MDGENAVQVGMVPHDLIDSRKNPIQRRSPRLTPMGGHQHQSRTTLDGRTDNIVQARVGNRITLFRHLQNGVDDGIAHYNDSIARNVLVQQAVQRPSSGHQVHLGDHAHDATVGFLRERRSQIAGP